MPRDDAGFVVCEVLWVDRFGNCQLNVGPLDVAALGERMQVSVGDLAGEPRVRVAALARTFADVGVGAVGLVTDSYGMLALALDRRSAADELGIAAGDQVLLGPLGELDGGSPPASVSMSPTRRHEETASSLAPCGQPPRSPSVCSCWPSWPPGLISLLRL